MLMNNIKGFNHPMVKVKVKKAVEFGNWGCFNHPMVKVKAEKSMGNIQNFSVSTTLWWKLKHGDMYSDKPAIEFQPPYGES